MRWFRSVQKVLDFPVPVRSGGIRFWVLLIRDFAYVTQANGGEAVTHGIFEKLIRDLDITCLFDVGANVGGFTWHSLQVRPSMDAYLFEPDPANLRLLRRTLRSNRLDRVRLWEGVVSDIVGPRTFLIDDASGAMGSVVDCTDNPHSAHSAYGMHRKIEVPSTTLDRYCGSISEGTRVLLKIDVEGAEALVFEGASAFLRRLRPLIIVESFDPKPVEALAESGYVIFGIGENWNFLCVPWEDVEAVRRSVQLSEPIRRPPSQG